MMAYRGRTLPPAPPPPPPPPPKSKSRTLSGQYSQYEKKSSNNLNIPGSSLEHQQPQKSSSRSRSISNISRISHSNHSTDSAVTSSSSSSSSGSGESTTPHSMSPTSRLLDEFETSKIELFYRSHRTFVYVGQSLVTLLFTETELVDGGRLSRPKSQEWRQVCHGVPVLLFNRGDTRSRDKRQIRICVAEHGTGFQLWSDVIDNLSNYQSLKPTFHTMYLSTDHRKMAGLAFENQFAALEFYRQIEIIVADPLNISLTGPKKKSTEKFKLFRRQRSKSVGRSSDMGTRESNPFSDPFINGHSKQHSKRPGKNDISAPCLFQHVTSINLSNYDSQIESLEYPNNVNSKRQDHNISSDYSTPFPIHAQYRPRNQSTPNSTSA